MSCSINICAAVEIYRSQIEVQLNIDQSKRYGITIFRKIDMAFICRWEPFTHDLEMLKNDLRGILNVAIQYGSIAYYQEGTFLFENYNLEHEVLPYDSDVLTHEKIEQICQALSKHDTSEFQQGHVSYLGEQW
jgi:hypothetical protein